MTPSRVDSSDSRELLLVYGTLLPGLAPPELSNLVKRLQPRGPATVSGLLIDFGEYPGLVIDPACLEASTPPHERRALETLWREDAGGETARRVRARVRGEILEVPPDPAVWKALDAYEVCRNNDANSEYWRVTARVRTDSGEVAAQVYVLPRLPPEPLWIPAGDYEAR